MSRETDAPAIAPLPPIARSGLPWDVPIDDTVASLGRLRAEHGDTFVVDSGEDRYLFLFSSQGVKSFYEIEEAVASKGIADWKMLRRKLPDELFLDRRTLPHELFGRAEVEMYLEALEHAIDAQLAELDVDTEIEVFQFARRLGHRLGLASWAGVESLDHPDLESLIDALDALDPAASFVDPALMERVAASGKAAEWDALHTAERILGDVVAQRLQAGPVGDLFDEVLATWSDTDDSTRRRGVARDVILVHLGSMSNLFAALAWSIVDLSTHRDVLARVAAGEPGLVAHCVLESTRLAQRSIMLRTVLRDCTIDDARGQLEVATGCTLATFLPLTNSEGPGLDRYDPDRWTRGRLGEPPPGGVETVTTFGHGPHACPARPYSIRAIGRVLERLVETHDLHPPDRAPQQRRGQIGGVARSEHPCVVRWVQRR